MKLIPGWRRASRLWSVRLSAIGAFVSSLALMAPDALLAMWNAMPIELRALVPAHAGLAIAVLLFAATMVARVVQQREAGDGD